MVLVRPDGTQQTLLTQLDGLDGPTATLFGRWVTGGAYELYITNGSFPFFPSPGNGPSLLRVTMDVAGLPRH